MHSIMSKLSLSVLLLLANALQGQIHQQDMPEIRQMTARYIKEKQPQRYAREKAVLANLDQLSEQGVFRDIALEKLNPESTTLKTQRKISTLLREAFFRLQNIAWSYSNGLIQGEQIKERVFRSAVHYGSIELRRVQSSARWPFSPFLYPECASVIYFSFLDFLKGFFCGVNMTKYLYENVYEKADFVRKKYMVELDR